MSRRIPGIAPRLALAAAAMLTMALTPARAAEALVEKEAGNFAPGQWIVSPWSRATGQVGGRGQLDAVVNFSGKGFEHLTVQPAEPLFVPGVAKRIRVRYRHGDGYGLIMKFRDGWGREEIPGKKFEWGLPPGADWQEAAFDIPPDWVMPIEIAGFATHNWGKDRIKAEFPFAIASLRAEADVGTVDPVTGRLPDWRPDPLPAKPEAARKECPAVPLVRAAISSGQLSNVFAGEPPGVRVTLVNWLPGKLDAKLAYEVLDNDGAPLLSGQRTITAEGFGDTFIPLPVEAYGRYRLKASLGLDNGTTIAEEMTFAVLPPPRQLTAEQRRRSPYGLNVHAGKTNGDLHSYLPAFVKAGIVWYRDYAWDHGWIERAQGDDGKFRGWPYYDKIVRQADELGIVLLPCLKGSIRLPIEADGKVMPVEDYRDWSRLLAAVVSAFPEISHWELDNEYGLHQGGAGDRLEPPIDWRNYREHHRRFAAIVAAIGGGDLVAVENGRAGIHPEKVAACVRSGDFAGIGVVNSHHYCGIEPPETNGANMNTGGGGEAGTDKVRSFYDMLRDAKRAGALDGQAREHWLTEFGWDTLAGKVVTPRQQAAYLQRGWMLALAAGTDKCFWFAEDDAPNPTVFFDGCGLLGPRPKQEPKLALCAMAGLAHVLPVPEYVGSLDAGDGTWGYLFRQNGRLVAALWMLDREDGVEADLGGAALLDFLGNPRPGGKARLGLAPTYAVGIAQESHWYAQTAYELASQWVDAAAAGDRIVPAVAVANNRSSRLKATFALTLPSGWEDVGGPSGVDLAPGETAVVELPCVIARTEGIGSRRIAIRVSEDGNVLKTMTATVQVRAPFALKVSPLGNQPGTREVAVTAANLSAGARAGTVSLRLPASWRAEPSSVAMPELAPGQRQEHRFRVTWSTDIGDGERAVAVLDAPGIEAVVQPLIPGAMRMHRAQGITVDGDLGDWDARFLLPAWTVGSTLGEPGARIWSAWAPEGLYVALRVEDSVLNTTDPRSFWLGDALELFIDTADSKRHREFEPGDHQFWIVPQVADGSVYAGQWKRRDEIPEIRYAIPGVKGVSRRDGQGYAMELLLPAAAMHGYAPRAGGRIGLNLNLNIKGARHDREVFWPEAKSWGIMNLPKHWGSVELAD